MFVLVVLYHRSVCADLFYTSEKPKVWIGQLGLHSCGGKYQTALLLKALHGAEFSTDCCHPPERVGGMRSRARTWEPYRGADRIVTYAVLQGV